MPLLIDARQAYLLDLVAVKETLQLASLLCQGLAKVFQVQIGQQQERRLEAVATGVRVVAHMHVVQECAHAEFPIVLKKHSAMRSSCLLDPSCLLGDQVASIEDLWT